MSIIATATLDGADGTEGAKSLEGPLVDLGEHERELFAAIADALGGRLVGWDPVRVAAISAAQGSAASLFHPQLLERLMRAGVDSDDAERVTLALDVARRIAAWWPAERPRVQSPADLAAITLPVFGRATQEELHVAIVDGRNGLLALRSTSEPQRGQACASASCCARCSITVASASRWCTTTRAATQNPPTKICDSPPRCSPLRASSTWSSLIISCSGTAAGRASAHCEGRSGGRSARGPSPLVRG